MHITRSIDYAVVISGEIDLELDDGLKVTVRAGDVIVQRQTIHNWENRGAEPCRIAFILIESGMD
jgi:quercetin dioxygenase-like cupin family protein